MKLWQPTVLALALVSAFPSIAVAQSNAELLNELKALRERVGQLEQKLNGTAATAAPAAAQWGMTPDQVREFNRIAVKTEATEDNLIASGLKGLTVSGYIEPVYIYNQRQHRAGFQFLNDQSIYAYDTSYMGAASIDFTKETDSGTRWKLTLTPNRGVGSLIGAGIVQEASVSIPLSDPTTRLIAGQIPDWSGYEYQQPTLNPFTTHNLLYDFTLPTGYTGVGVSMNLGKLAFKTMVANINASIKAENDKSAALVYRGDYGLDEFSGIGFAGLHGKAPNFNTGTNTTANLFEVDGYYTRGALTMQGQASVGMQKQGAITPDVDNNYRDSSWWGVSGLVGYNVTPRLQALVRADYIANKKNGGGLFGYNGYSPLCAPEDGVTPCMNSLGDSVPVGSLVDYGNDDRNGLGPDLSGDLNRGANRYALSFGLKYAFNTSTTFKAEYRLDGADRAVFIDAKDGTYHKQNSLLGASVVVNF